MANQKGLKISDHERLIFDRPSNDRIDFTTRPALYFDHPSARLPDSKLLMVDRITYLAPEGGEANLGSIRGEKDVDVTEWFFKAHFFQDPVQPGSLGIEAMLQLMQALMIAQGKHEGFAKPRFEPVGISEETEWHYRGQITPDKKLITIDFECTEYTESKDGNSALMFGEARLWGDGLKIYHAPRIGLRIVEDDAGLASSRKVTRKTTKKTSKNVAGKAAREFGSGLTEQVAKNKNGEGERFNWRQIRDYWIERSGGEHYLVHDLGAALMRQFVNRIVLTDEREFQTRRGQPAIYLGNHQVGVESFLFLGMIAAMTGIPAEAIAKKEHRDTWLGQISQLTDEELKEQSTTRMLFFDRDDQSDMLRILKDFGETVHDQPRSLLVHVDGTRASRAGQSSAKVSSVLIDLAINDNIPIIPVRFAGGLPVEASDERLEFPTGYAGQDYYLGSVIEATELEALPYVDRAKRVLAAINNLGPSGPADKPYAIDEAFSKLVESQSSRTEIQRVLWAALQSIPEPGKRTQKLLADIAEGNREGLSRAENIVMNLLG